MSAVKPDIVQTRGRCELPGKHEAHVFFRAEYETHRSFWDCPGQYSECGNCDDRKCMACIFREVHDQCEDSCPECCGPVSESILAPPSMN